MDSALWNPNSNYSKQEELLAKRLKRTRKLFRFLRDYRHELFDDGFQTQLVEIYRTTGAGKALVPPALMAMAVLLQGYVGASDAEAVELTVVDLRWQMVLGRLGATEPAFSQGALHDFRHRLIRTDMDRRLLERTVELARRTGGFDARKLPKSLRVAMDSSPLEGAGRVEETINLLAHAVRNVVKCVAGLLERDFDEVCREAGIPLLTATSVKKGLDRPWTASNEKTEALRELVEQIESLERWLRARLADEVKRPPLKEQVEILTQIAEQDLEPDPDGSGPRVRKGVAPDRRVSVEDGEMRHGRKSKSIRFNGFKRHIAKDSDDGLVLACAITPANRPEEEAAANMKADIDAQGASIAELQIDRGYITSPIVGEVLASGGDVVCRPWAHRNGKLFTKNDFNIDLDDMTATCPAGQTETIRLGRTIMFAPSVCGMCSIRAQCTEASPQNGRSLRIAANEHLQQQLRVAAGTPEGREKLRERVAVEHGLAHIGQRQGRRARYFGVRANLFDLRRAAAIQNLETVQRNAA